MQGHGVENGGMHRRCCPVVLSAALSQIVGIPKQCFLDVFNSSRQDEIELERKRLADAQFKAARSRFKDLLPGRAIESRGEAMLPLLCRTQCD